MRRLLEPSLLVALAVVVLFDAAGYPEALAEGAPGPGLFPRILAFVLIGCAGVLGWRAVRGRRAHPPPALHDSRPWAFAAAAGWMAGALGALPHLGTPATLPMLVGGLLWLGGERSPRLLIGLPIGFAAVVWLLFDHGLGVPLP